jgi:hypothetical protein
MKTNEERTREIKEYKVSYSLIINNLETILNLLYSNKEINK